MRAKGRKVLEAEDAYQLREPVASYSTGFASPNDALRFENSHFWNVYPEISAEERRDARAEIALHSKVQIESGSKGTAEGLRKLGIVRGRNARYQAPPAQITACGFPASGELLPQVMDVWQMRDSGTCARAEPS